MYHIHRLATMIAMVSGALASCDHDSCYRAVEHHQNTESTFCGKHLATGSVSVACNLASYDPHVCCLQRSFGLSLVNQS